MELRKKLAFAISQKPESLIINLGHATVAYFGYYKHPQATFIYEVLEDSEVHAFAKSVMLQAAHVLKAVYPGDFSLEDLEAHVEDLSFRIIKSWNPEIAFCNCLFTY